MSIDAALGRLGIQTGVCTGSTRPANPYEGQVIYETDTNNLRFWSGSAWESNKGAVISSAAPTSPAAGDIWYDSDDGRAYVYYDDGSSQQWVEFGAPPSGSTIALASYADSAARTTAIPSPTEADLSYLQDTNSVEVYDGSAWAAVGAGGGTALIASSTFTTSSAISIDNCFTSDYSTYQIHLQSSQAGGASDIQMRFRSGGTDTSANYDMRKAVLRFNDGYFAQDGGGNAQTYMTLSYPSSARAHHSITVWEPYESTYTSMWFNSAQPDFIQWGGGTHTVNTSFDGFTIFPNTGTLTGTIYVYGWVKS